jgi:hypothetical protein
MSQRRFLLEEYADDPSGHTESELTCASNISRFRISRLTLMMQPEADAISWSYE